MNKMRDGYDIRNYSASARKELLSGGTIEIRKKEGIEIIAVVPRLALVVTSRAARHYLVSHPEATAICPSQDHIEDRAVAHLMQ